MRIEVNDCYFSVDFESCQQTIFKEYQNKGIHNYNYNYKKEKKQKKQQQKKTTTKTGQQNLDSSMGKVGCQVTSRTGPNLFI